jgi:hypothetical protein|tara:strand:+ start:28932 stop:29633 length:702 start_codon:yes stop_codon:yes gene_type:complete
MKHQHLFPILTLLLFSVGCSVYSVVSSDKDNKADFSKYKTFAWLPDRDNSDKILNNQIMRNNIKNYFTHEFVDNYGFTANTDTPDVLMEITVTVANKTETEKNAVTTTVPTYSRGYYNDNNTPIYQYNYPYNYNNYPVNNYSGNRYYSSQPNPYNYNGYNTGYRYQTTYVKEKQDYTRSTITVGMIDSKRNELVWTATAQADIYDDYTQNAKDDIHPAVHKMLESFPIKRIPK